MENTAAVLLPDLMRFRKYVDKDAFPRLPWKQDRRSEQVSAASKSRWISWWLVIWGRWWPSGGGSSSHGISPSCPFLRTNSRTETPTPPWLFFSEHIVLPCKFCESRRTYTLSTTKLEMPRVLLFFQILINWWCFYLKRNKQLQNALSLFSSSNMGLCDFIQSQTHFWRKLLVLMNRIGYPVLPAKLTISRVKGSSPKTGFRPNLCCHQLNSTIYKL